MEPPHRPGDSGKHQKNIMISMYTRDDQGKIEYHGPQGWASENAYLLQHGLQGLDPETERLQGWPHSQVRWYCHPDAPSIAAVGIGG